MTSLTSSARGRGRSSLAALLLLLTACQVGPPEPQDTAPTGVPSAAETGSAGTAAPSDAGSPEASPDAGEQRRARTRMVVVVSVDGLRSSILAEPGSLDLAAFDRMRAEGASTLEARTLVESTDTLPNHTGMLTSRRESAARGGHGVRINVDPGASTTVQTLAGGPVASVFDDLDGVYRTSAMFASKDKFALLERSWPSLDRYAYESDNAELVDLALDDLRDHDRGLTFIHLSAPDKAGHASGWESKAYADAVAASDTLVGELLDAVKEDRRLRRHVVVVVTADHGGAGPTHRDPELPADYTIPFLVWGRGVPAGADLYGLNAERRRPRVDQQPGYGQARQPIRNADVGNLVASLVGAPPIEGSQIGLDGLRVLRRG